MLVPSLVLLSAVVQDFRGAGGVWGEEGCLGLRVGFGFANFWALVGLKEWIPKENEEERG